MQSSTKVEEELSIIMGNSRDKEMCRRHYNELGIILIEPVPTGLRKIPR
jgi:hypothetical protein